ncbi:hypothetical protein KQI61_15435 [Anaerocolumna aminovalerica]|uniref:hypothetical protein n=1 Tax=Anaerocolumna aminovalerica TaxID=1527 RepID=UPI001C0F3065|nr:hypothetical protein [Anaerocolumna aminovalerica]MBU5333591.1 hypothetical protein [Anaerocolumna aminovalerica]
MNEEKEHLEIDTIKIQHAGYYNYHMPIIYCPICGTVLNKYKNIDKTGIKRFVTYGI